MRETNPLTLPPAPTVVLVYGYKAYVLIYSDQIGSRNAVKDWADNSKLVITWRYDLPHCFYLISTSTAIELANELRAATGNTGRFLITEVSENRYG